MKIRIRWSEKRSYDELEPSRLCIYWYERKDDQRPHYIGIVGEKNPDSTFGNRYIRGSYGHFIQAAFHGGYRWFIGHIEKPIISGREASRLIANAEGNLIKQFDPVSNNPKKHSPLEIDHSGDLPPAISARQVNKSLPK